MNSSSFSIAEPALWLTPGQGMTSWKQVAPGNAGRGWTGPEIQSLGITPVSPTAERPHGDGWLYRRTSRPAQGHLSSHPTRGIVVVMLDARHPDDPAAVAALRDWADFVHIPAIVAADVPGLTMISPYEIVGNGPRYLHVYEFDHDDPEAGLKELGRRLQARLSPEELERFASHPERRRAYAGSYKRLD